jgi:hypothetical protein
MLRERHLLARPFLKPTLVMPKVGVLERPIPTHLPKSIDTTFRADAERQIKILDTEGYEVGDDAFSPVLENKEKCIAVITDFGRIQKKKN